MKHIIAAIILAAMAAAPLARAQAPRIRTSAPREKTAQLKGKTPEKKPEANAKAAPAKKAGKVKPKKTADSSGRFLAVKTNIAYDAFAVLNAEFEIQVARHFSVDIPLIWSLWDWKQDFGLRTFAVQPEARYWFGNVGKGSAVGINVGVATYNFRHNDIRYQNDGRPLLSAAVTYAYALPIGNRWSAEFSLAVGYANTRYNRYYNIDNGAYINSKTKNYFGPTKVGISLSYRLGK